MDRDSDGDVMLFYVFVITLTTLLAFIYSHTKGKQIKKLLYVLLFFFPAIIAGLRGVGTDIRHYYEHANDIVAGIYNYVDYKSIFVQITRILLKHDISFQIVLLAVSIITLHIMFKIFAMYRKNFIMVP